MNDFGSREGEQELPFDPEGATGDGHVVFIGRIRSPWMTRDECPKNMAVARERGQLATLEIDPPFRPGLRGWKRTAMSRSSPGSIARRGI